MPDIGQTILHYRIIEKLGQGGMGEVYRATDTKLGRDVALKVLPAGMASNPERLERFRREAKALAVLDHTGIVTVYSIEEVDGVHFLTMQLVEGDLLNKLIPEGGFPIDRILDIATALADAVAVAHEKGIVHRDLKPANVILARDGHLKVLDFGLARMSGREIDEADRPELLTDLDTREGVVMGTVPYMSPEQVSGRGVDHRSDLFSIGVILYELATGKRPFRGDSSAELASSILRDTPRPLDELRSDLPAELDSIIRRCLEKGTGDRYQTARDLRNELRALRQRIESGRSPTAAHPAPQTAPAAAMDPGPSVAVLPFQNLSADPENEYFSDGLAEEILNALSRIDGLRVAARASSFSFKGRATDIAEIGAKLRVANLLQGSIRRAGSRVRVMVQLVDAANGFQLWSERYDRQMEDIFDVQDEIARAITARLELTLAEGVRRSTKNLEAYELYLKGRHHWHQRSPATLRVAIRCFEQVIELDPQYALAYAGLADCYGILRVYGWLSAEFGRPPAHAAMIKAMALAPSSWETNFSRAFYTFYFEPAWREAEPHFQKAIAINPRSSLALAYYGVFLSMARRADDAVEYATVACQLDPLSPFIHGLAALALQVLGRFDEADRAALRALELQPDYLLALWPRGMALCGLGRSEEAIEVLERAATLSRAPIFLGMLGLACGRAGRLDDATRLLRELEDRASRGEYVPAFTHLSIQVGLGDIEAIRRLLRTAMAEATPPMSLGATSGQLLEPFRSDPEIHRLLFELYGW
jgi:serine/threonine protein kinase/Tfp pilus assembly protein PilF